MPQRFILFSLILLLGTPSLGQFANPHLDNAKAMEAELNYEEMPEELAAALSQPGNTPAELIEIYRLLGMAHLALRHTDKAKYAFIKLLTLDPTFQMPSSENPRFRKAFGDIKAEFEATGRVTVAYEPPEWSDLNVGEAPASFPVQFQVTDKYEQVVSATVELTLTVNGNQGSPVQTKLSQSGRNGNITIFAGQVSNPGASFPAGTIQYYEIAYALVLENQTKKRLDLNPPFVPVVLKIGDPGATMNEPQKKQTPVAQPSPQQPQPRTQPEIVRAPDTPELHRPATSGSTSLIVTGIVVGTVVIIGGSLLAYYCVVGDACSSPAPEPIPPGSLDVIVTPSASE